MKRTTVKRQAPSVISRPALTRQRRTVMGRAVVLLAVGGLTSVVLSGCTAGPSATPPAAGTQPPATQSPVEGAGSGIVAAPGPGSSATGTAGKAGATAPESPATAAMRQTVTAALNRLAAGTPKPATAQVTEALTGAGVQPSVLEVSASRSPTGLEADAIESAVLQGTDCVFGHIRDGSVTVTVLPVLATGKCFVGAAA
jgi:hypothetical protein